MRVNIGKYKHYIGPYQLAEKLCFWGKRKYYDPVEGGYEPWVRDFGKFLSNTFITDICQWVDSKRKRKIKVRIDHWDTWDAGHTLMHIALPLLKEYRKDLHGAPFTDDDDVPERLRSTSAKPKEIEYDTDEFHFDRWDWILDEIIWAMEESLDEDAESKFHEGNINFVFEPLNDGSGCSKMVRGPDDTSVYYAEAHKAWNKRRQKALTLFGKYLLAMWD